MTGDVVTQPGGAGAGIALVGSIYAATAEDVAVLENFCSGALT